MAIISNGPNSNVLNTSNYLPGELSIIKLRVLLWNKKPNKNHYKIISALVHSTTPLTSGQFLEIVAALNISKNPFVAIHSLKTTKSRAYGKIFIEVNGYIQFTPEILPSIKKLTW